MANKSKERFKMLPTPQGCRFVDSELDAVLDFNKRTNQWTLQCSGDEVADVIIAVFALGSYAEHEGALYRSIV